MLNSIIHFSIKNKLVIGLLTISLIVIGVYEASRLPIDAVPDITNNQVQVITIAPSYGASDIERLITFPIEKQLSNMADIVELRSFSRFGLSLITIVFKDNIRVEYARQQVVERLQTIQSLLPKNIDPPYLGPVSTGLGEIYQYVLRPEARFKHKYDAMQLRTIQDWIVRRQLLGVEGVAEVSSFGGKLKQYEVAIFSDRLVAYRITIPEVLSVLEKNNQNAGGSYIEKNSQAIFIRSEGLIENIEDIKNIPVKTSGNAIITIQDIADVKLNYATRYGALCYNDEGEVAGGIVMMLKGANSNFVIENVKNKVEQIRKNLPEGVVLEPFLNRTKMVNSAIKTVRNNLLEGATIVIFILVLFLGNFRAGLVVASVIPLALLFAFVMMNAFGVSGNLMSLGALDFGLIVDGAVIIVEATMFQLTLFYKQSKATHITQEEMNREVAFSSKKMMNSAIFGQMIILIVYLPLFTLQGVEGRMFKPMAQTTMFALIGAFILSMTYVPMMSAFVLSKKKKGLAEFSEKFLHFIENKFRVALTKVLHYPKWVLITTSILFGIALYTLTTLGGEFIPELEEGDFAVDTRVLTGSSLETTIEFTQKASKVLLQNFPEIEKVVTKIGSGEVPTDPMPMEASDMMIILKPKSEWTSASSFPELSEKMSQTLAANVAGITTGFQYPVQMRFNELITGARQDVVCKIFGEDLDSLTRYAKEIGRIVKNIQGSEGVYVETVTGTPQIVIKYNRLALLRYGLHVEDVNTIMNVAYAGRSVGKVYEGEKSFDLVVRLEEKERQTIEQIRNLPITNPDGLVVLLHQIADVDLIQGPNQIQREDAKRRIVVGFNVKNRDVESVIHELQKKVNEEVDFAAGYYVNYGGAFENLNRAKARLSIAVPIALALIFILLFFAFRSVKYSLLIYSSIPLSAIGGIFFLAWRGLPFSVSAGVGFVALFGVAVLNGIVLLAEFNRLKKEHPHASISDIVIEGTATRLRPVLMTASVASLGFLPMAISQGAGAEVQRPLATVVIGGLVVATLLTLFVLPVLFVLIEKRKRRRQSSSPKMMTLIAVSLFASMSVFGQESISLQEALDSAKNNSFKIRNSLLRLESISKQKGSTISLPSTNLTAEYGQINSIYNDTKIGISQSFAFPTVYTKQKSIWKEKLSQANNLVNLTQAEIDREVKTLFYDILILQEKKKLLSFLDSTQQVLQNISEVRFQVGAESSATHIAMQFLRNQVQTQLAMLDNTLQARLIDLQYLLQTQTHYMPVASSFQYTFETSDSFAIFSHPQIQYFLNEKRIAEKTIAHSKMLFLPTFNLGFASMSMQGSGADGVLYGSQMRFNSWQFGLNVPLAFHSHLSQLRSLQADHRQVENMLNQKIQELTKERKKTLKEYFSLLHVVEDYKKNNSKNLDTFVSITNLQYQTGQIDFSVWLTLQNQALQSQMNFLDAMQMLNEKSIYLYYLSTSN